MITTNKLTNRLLQYHLNIIYSLGKINIEADTLSKKYPFYDFGNDDDILILN